MWVKASPGLFFYHGKAPKPCCYEVSYINANAIGHLLERLGRKGAVCKCPIRVWGTHPEQITMAPDESRASAGRKCQRFVVNHSKQGENLGNWIVVGPAFDLLYMQKRKIAVLYIWMEEFCLNCMFCAVNWFGLWCIAHKRWNQLNMRHFSRWHYTIILKDITVVQSMLHEMWIRIESW